jgi:hypothetical protein
MIKPTINLNGSSADDLIRPRRDAMGHLRNAIEALRQAAPNGRDYPGDSDRCVVDRETHFARLEAIKALSEAIYAEALAIQEGARK